MPILFWLRTWGFDLRQFRSALTGMPRFRKDRRALRSTLDSSFAWGRELPIVSEWNESSGSLGTYFHQDLRVARWIYSAQPQRHVDVGSRIDGFIGNLATFREVEVLDIRPQPQTVPGVKFHRLDLMSPLPAEWTACTDSLSCLHTIEHFGLGRYGDPVNAMGYLAGLEQLKRIVAPGGLFYLSTPMGPQRVEFNAHRVFAASTIIGWFGEGWTIEQMAVLDDQNEWREVDHRNPSEVKSHFGCQLGVGIVAARKNS